MPHLFDPLTLRSVTLRNRIGMPPMCQYSAQDGLAADWHMVHYGSRAAGGAGLVIVEATAVEPRGRISPNDLGIWSDEHAERLARIVRFVREQGAVPAIQLGHAGRKAGTARPWDGGKPLSDEQGGWEIVGPSAIPFDEGFRTPSALSEEGIAAIQQAFVLATRRAAEAGFEMVELHGAHGYLVHSFHSPLSNRRVDRYGGSFENRVRFTLETVTAMRRVWPDQRPMAVRISCTDWAEGGWTAEESVELARRLKGLGVDLMDCSSGGGTPLAKVPAGAGYQVPLAEAVRRGAGIATAAVGLITQAMQADEIVRNQRSDVVLVGRELLRNPYWPMHAARTLRQVGHAATPKQYLRAF